MTDNKIVKALECFAIEKDFDEQHCIGCVFEHQFCSANMSNDIAKLTLDLINRQKEEIERLNKFALIRNLDRCEAEIKSEAYKEFAERLNKEFDEQRREYRNVLNSDGACAMIIAIKTTNNLLKELVGDDG